MALVTTGRQHMAGATQGFERAAAMESQRNMANENMAAMKGQQRMTNIGMGAGIGYMMAKGGAVGGPWGAVIGAAAGLLASELF